MSAAPVSTPAPAQAGTTQVHAIYWRDGSHGHWTLERTDLDPAHARLVADSLIGKTVGRWRRDHTLVLALPPGATRAPQMLPVGREQAAVEAATRELPSGVVAVPVPGKDAGKVKTAAKAPPGKPRGGA